MQDKYALTDEAAAVLRRFDNPEPPPIVYHYTSLETALKILNGFEVWCVDVAFSNDPSEGLHGRKIIAEALAADPSVWMERAQLITDDIACYASSFSAEPDLLTQWRYYAANGTGVAVGIDRAALESRTNVTFSTVVYDRKVQLQLVSEVLSVFRQAVEDASSDEGKLLPLVSSVALYSVILQAILKNPAYSPENEYRLFDALPKDEKHHATSLKHFQRGGQQVPYFPVDLRDSTAASAACPIREVWVGPCLDLAAATADLQSTVAYQLGKFQIARSEVPMRCG